MLIEKGGKKLGINIDDSIHKEYKEEKDEEWMHKLFEQEEKRAGNLPLILKEKYNLLFCGSSTKLGNFDKRLFRKNTFSRSKS